MNQQVKRIFAWCLFAASLPCLVPAEKHEAQPSPLRSSSQLIVVTTSDWNAVDGQLQMYQRTSPGGSWTMLGAPIPIVVGKGGMGWGIGVTPMRAPGDPVKQEGDHKSPAGIFRLGSAFGYAPQAPDEWKMHYIALTPATDCVDDPQSRFYNRILDSSAVVPDWKSAEHMRDAGEAYRWGLVIDHNTGSPKPHGGSCVFMHIWGGAGHGTEGCTAMPEAQVQSILAWLNPQAKPLLVQMPLRQYRNVEKSLHLPTLPSTVVQP
jgi:L,D-peptidoglycan transpeptidase YkuD (ErfK/YbiS/YcfS/YnhG family)